MKTRFYFALTWPIEASEEEAGLGVILYLRSRKTRAEEYIDYRDAIVFKMFSFHTKTQRHLFQIAR